MSDTHKEQKKAIFASGCFWGTEYHFQRARGVISTTVGYTGGHLEKPSYEQVCSSTSGHAEAVEVIYNPAQTSYEKLAKLFFNTHDFTQLNRQGPDIGEQYRSEIFYLDDEQRKIAEKLTGQLEDKGFKVATKVTKAGVFFEAENYHQDYFNKTGGTPSCHAYKKVFGSSVNRVGYLSPRKKGDSPHETSNLMLSIYYAVNPYLYCIYSPGWTVPFFFSI
jgi:peptide methionine sulfoxide reductase msrA/msrB